MKYIALILQHKKRVCSLKIAKGKGTFSSKKYVTRCAHTHKSAIKIFPQNSRKSSPLLKQISAEVLQA